LIVADAGRYDNERLIHPRSCPWWWWSRTSAGWG